MERRSEDPLKIAKMRWYKVLVDGVEHIVRVDDRIMKYCVIDYYDGRLWTTGSAAKCKKWVDDHLLKRIDNNGKTIYRGAWQR